MQRKKNLYQGPLEHINDDVIKRWELHRDWWATLCKRLNINADPRDRPSSWPTTLSVYNRNARVRTWLEEVWSIQELVTLKRTQFQCPSRRQKLCILNMFRFRTIHGNGHHSAKWVFWYNYSPGVLLRLFSFFFTVHFPIYIACYLGINLFCIFHRWTWRQYTEPCECKWSTSLITAYLSLYVIPSCGRRDGNRTTSNPSAIQLEHCALYIHPRLDAALLVCNKRG